MLIGLKNGIRSEIKAFGLRFLPIGVMVSDI